MRFGICLVVLVCCCWLTPAQADVSCEFAPELRELAYDDAVEWLDTKCDVCESACVGSRILTQWNVCLLEQRKCPEVDGVGREALERGDYKVILRHMSHQRRAFRQAKDVERNRRLREEEKRQAELDEAVPPTALDSAAVGAALHAAYSGQSQLSNGTIAVILGVDPNAFSRCDEEYCYTMAGIVKSKLTLSDTPVCQKFTSKAATCEFTVKLVVESTLSDSSDFRNEWLRAMAGMERLSATGALEFKQRSWQFVTLELE